MPTPRQIELEAQYDDACDARDAYAKNVWASAKQAYSQHSQRLSERRTMALHLRETLTRILNEIEKLMPKSNALALALSKLPDGVKPVLQKQHDDTQTQLDALLSSVATTCGHIVAVSEEIAELETNTEAVTEQLRVAEKTLESLREKVQAANLELHPELVPRVVRGVEL